MTAIWIILGVVIGVPILIMIWAIALYNGLVRKKTMVMEGWSGIDVQLKRRSNLIPNLVETVKGFAAQEKDVLTEVTTLRGQAQSVTGPGEASGIEGAITGALGRLMMVAEAYPELKSDSNFLNLQSELAEIEEDIEKSRRYYNATVRDLNVAIESFPGNLLAARFSFQQAEFFETQSPDERAVPQISFS